MKKKSRNSIDPEMEKEIRKFLKLAEEFYDEQYEKGEKVVENKH